MKPYFYLQNAGKATKELFLWKKPFFVEDKNYLGVIVWSFAGVYNIVATHVAQDGVFLSLGWLYVILLYLYKYIYLLLIKT